MLDIDPKVLEAAAMAIRDIVCSRGRLNGKAKDWASLPPRQREYYLEEAKAALMAAAFFDPPIIVPDDMEFSPDVRPGAIVHRVRR